ncbi:hypothetical protein BDZ89DRAFT_1116140 [Hymenopellis radicata]|nr:hypothetical protein BDZ89DRAFT_1116140 [Hymenopellis radicata]
MNASLASKVSMPTGQEYRRAFDALRIPFLCVTPRSKGSLHIEPTYTKQLGCCAIIILILHNEHWHRAQTGSYSSSTDTSCRRDAACSSIFSSSAPRSTSNSALPAQLPDDFIAIRSTQEGSDEGPRLTVMPRSALLQRTFSTALEYLAPQISNATFTTRDMPGFEGTPVNIAPEHWDELLPHTKLMETKLPPLCEVRRAEKPVVPSPRERRSWWMEPSGIAVITFLVLVILIEIGKDCERLSADQRRQESVSRDLRPRLIKGNLNSEI